MFLTENMKGRCVFYCEEFLAVVSAITDGLFAERI